MNMPMDQKEDEKLTYKKPDLDMERYAKLKAWLYDRKIRINELAKALGYYDSSALGTTLKRKTTSHWRRKRMLDLGIPEELIPGPLTSIREWSPRWPDSAKFKKDFDSDLEDDTGVGDTGVDDDR